MALGERWIRRFSGQIPRRETAPGLIHMFLSGGLHAQTLGLAGAHTSGSLPARKDAAGAGDISRLFARGRAGLRRFYGGAEGVFLNGRFPPGAAP